VRDLPFRFAFRKLWAAHVRRTRNYLYSVLTGRPARDLEALASSLLRNQDDIGNALKPMVGEAAGGKVATLLRDHINIAVRLLVALKAGDQAALGKETSAWYANAGEIATYLATLRPAWKRDTISPMLNKHLKLTIEEAVAAKKGDWIGFAEAYRRGFQHMLNFADLLSTED
jgi:hypothetical protein